MHPNVRPSLISSSEMLKKINFALTLTLLFGDSSRLSRILLVPRVDNRLDFGQDTQNSAGVNPGGRIAPKRNS